MWDEPWPDFTRFEKQIGRLLEAGEADAVAGMLPRFVRLAAERLEHGGEDDWEIEQVVEAMVPAVRRCSLPDAAKLHLAADCLLADDYGFAAPLEAVWEDRWDPAVWGRAAELLLADLKSIERPAPEASSSPRYQLGRRVLRVVEALDAAGEVDRSTELLVAEALPAGLAEKAVTRLIGLEQLDRARSLAEEGIAATPEIHRGVLHRLQELLAKIAERRGDPLPAAAVAAARFFERPSVETHGELIARATDAGVAEPVVAAARHFLETGEPPAAADWPLPRVPGAAPMTPARQQEPFFAVLIGLGIAAADRGAVRRWHLARVEHRQRRRGRGWHWEDLGVDQDVADFLAPTDPELAAGIHFHLADDCANRNGTNHYPDAAAHLHTAQRLLAAPEHEAELRRLRSAFQAAHGSKWRLMEHVTGQPRRVKRR